MLFPEEIETERLRLRRLCHETVDVFEYYRLCSDHDPAIEEVTAYLPWSPHETVKETADYLDELEAKWENGTRAEYLIRPKEGQAGAGEIVGSGGLLINWETQTGKPAIWLRKEFWGNGYSGERADAMLGLAFERLDLDLVAIPVQDGNDRSRAAVEKYISSYGGQYDGVIRNSTVRPDGTIIATTVTQLPKRSIESSTRTLIRLYRLGLRTEASESPKRPSTGLMILKRFTKQISNLNTTFGRSHETVCTLVPDAGSCTDTDGTS